MKNHNPLTNSIDPVRNSRNRSSGAGWTRAFLLLRFALVLASFALSPTARAVDPPPDGGYPNENTAEGEDALFNLDTGSELSVANTAIGYHALFSTTEASSNTAIGHSALVNNVRGIGNVAVGAGALASNVDGWNSTAVGSGALLQNTAYYNTAIGSEALESNTTGGANTAVGTFAMALSTGDNNTATGFSALSGDLLTGSSSGSYNTADGAGALQNYINGSFNTATGFQALFINSDGGSNTANGYLALFSNTTGNFNVANGANALQSNTTGGGNVANGGFALFISTTGVNNVAEGFDALINNTTGNNNIALGISAGANLTTGNNNIDIGNSGVAGESAKIRIGTKPTHKNTYIAGIYGVTVARAIGVIIDSAGHLGTTTSSARFKEQIKPMDKASEAILSLQPVTFRYKKELDPDRIPQFGLVAEEVAKVNPDLVARDDEGKPYTVRYEAVNAVLLNEFLKEHRKVEEQQTTIAQLKSADARQEKEIAALTELVKEQAAQIRKVSAQVEVSKGRPQLVASKQ